MPKVIADIGINHNGDISKVLEMIDAVKHCGADYVKLQKRDIESCYTEEDLSKPCSSPWGATVGDKVYGRELAWSDFHLIANRCDERSLGWSASCFDLKSLEELETLYGERIAFHKVPSAMAKHEAFLKQVASYGRLTFISVGLASNLHEVKTVCRIFEELSCKYVLNITTALYPTSLARCNIARIETIRNFRFCELHHCVGVGYSGHEVGLLPSIVAVCFGATHIERHFTLDRSWYGADQASSLEPEGLRRLCRDVSQIEDIAGSPKIQLMGDEKNPVTFFKGTQ